MFLAGCDEEVCVKDFVFDLELILGGWRWLAMDIDMDGDLKKPT